MNFMLGARTSRPHQARSICQYNWIIFALRAQCGRDVRAPINLRRFLFRNCITTGRSDFLDTLAIPFLSSRADLFTLSE